MKIIYILMIAVLSIILMNSGCATPNPSTLTSEKPASSEPVPTPSSAFEKIIFESDLIVVGTITDRHYEIVHENSKEIIDDNDTRKKQASNSLYTLSIEKTIKGDAKITEVMIRVLGIMSSIHGVYYFQMGDKTLVCLRHEQETTYTVVVVEAGDLRQTGGMFWIENTPPLIVPSHNLRDTIGLVIVAMQKLELPVTLPQAEYPDLPVKVISPSSINLPRTAVP